MPGFFKTDQYGLVNEYYGKSTDTKPTTNITAGCVFVEIDTQIVYMWDGTQWVVFG